MGKSISIYLDDESINLLKKQDRSVSSTVKDALRIYLKAAERKKAFDQVLKSAESMGKATGFKAAEKSWMAERERDRW